jgi:VanZ family protein
MKNDVKKTVFLLLLIAYIIILIIGAVITIPSGVVSGNDKLFHFLEFFGLSIILLETLQMYNFKHYYIIGAIFVLLFVPFSEYIQTFTSIRTYSYYDMLADLSGIIVGFTLFKLAISKWKF